MTEQVLKFLGIEESTYPNYCTEQIINDNNILSQNDLAAIAKKKIFEMGYLVDVSMNTNGTYLVTIMDEDGEYEVNSVSNIERDCEGVFEMLDWLLSNKK